MQSARPAAGSADGNEAVRDVDALLLAAREGRRRQRPQPLGNVEPPQQGAGLLARLGARHPVRDQGLRDHVDGRHPRHRAQELADIADGGAAHAQHLPWLGRGKIDHGPLMTDADAAGVAAIIAKDHFQDRRFTGAGGAGQHHALARLDVERNAAHDRQFDPALQMHGEGLFGVADVDHRGHRRTHGGKIEETSNWV